MVYLGILQSKYRINFSLHMPAITEHGCEGGHSLPKALPPFQLSQGLLLFFMEKYIVYNKKSK